MGNPITWQNVNAPAMGNPAQYMQLAQNGIDGAFNKLGDVLKQREDVEKANWEAQKGNNTQAFLDQMTQFRTPQELQAAQASGQLDQLRQGYGAQVDRSALRTAEQAQLGVLQKRITDANTFANSEADQKSAPIMEAYRVAGVNGDTATQARIVAENPGMRGMGALLQDNQKRQQDVTKFGWDQATATHKEQLRPLEVDKFRSDLLTAESLRAAQAAQARAADANAAINTATLEDKRKAVVAASKAASDAAALKGTAYAEGIYTPADTEATMVMLTAAGVGDDAGERAKIIERLNGMATKGVAVQYTDPVTKQVSTTTLPPSKGQVKAALLSIKDQKLNWWDGGWANNFEDTLKKTMQTTTVGQDADGKPQVRNATLDGYQLLLETQRRAVEDPAIATGKGAGGGAAALDRAILTAKKKVKSRE